MRRLNKVTALVIAGVISCTSPMMVMASDSGSVMSQAEEILKDNEVGSLASDCSFFERFHNNTSFAEAVRSS